MPLDLLAQDAQGVGPGRLDIAGHNALCEPNRVNGVGADAPRRIQDKARLLPNHVRQESIGHYDVGDRIPRASVAALVGAARFPAARRIEVGLHAFRQAAPAREVEEQDGQVLPQPRLHQALRDLF